MEPLVIRLHENDNVVTAKSDLEINSKLDKENIITNQHIPVGHKVSTKNISKGEDIIKYDNIIGIALVIMIYTYCVAIKESKIR